MEKLKAIFDRPHDEVMKDLHQRRRRQRDRNLLVRCAIVAGASVLAFAGVVMTVLPGPKLPALAAGVYLLAFEFDWAERLVAWTLRKTEAAKRRYEDAGPIKKFAGVVAAIVTMVVFVVAFRTLVGWLA